MKLKSLFQQQSEEKISFVFRLYLFTHHYSFFVLFHILSIRHLKQDLVKDTNNQDKDLDKLYIHINIYHNPLLNSIITLLIKKMCFQSLF